MSVTAVLLMTNVLRHSRKKRNRMVQLLGLASWLPIWALVLGTGPPTPTLLSYEQAMAQGSMGSFIKKKPSVY